MPRVTEKRILIPADAPERRALEQALRAEGWAPLSYSGAEEAQATLSNAPPQAIILQTKRGEARATELIKSVRRLAPKAFVVGMGRGAGGHGTDVFVRDTSAPEEIAAALRLGAVMRDAQSAERTLRDQLRTIRKQVTSQAERIRELESACQSLEKTARSARELALRDELTGLYNRRFFMQALEREIERSKRDGRRFAVALLDIDHFKRYNDSFGHPAGDQALIVVGQALLRSLRRMDTVARYGGEEFILLLPETHGETEAPFEPARLVERLRVAVEKDAALTALNGLRKSLTISAGVALYPKDAKTAGKLIAKVDVRLYRAKRAGRNQVCAAEA